MKSNRLSCYTIGRDNNFNLLRFFAATLVLFSHSFALVLGSSSAEPLETTLNVTFGSIAVDVFFITSGFLVTASLLHRNNILDFIQARVLRIYPALFMAIIFSTFIVGLVFTTYSARIYLNDYEVYRFFVKNIILLDGIDYSLPGVFENVPFKNAVNGSLWTLPFEVKAYITLALIGTFYLVFNRYIKRLYLEAFLVIIGLSGLCLYLLNHYIYLVDPMSLKLFAMFFIGSAYYILKDKVIMSLSMFLLLGTLILLSSFDKEIFFVVYTLSIAYVVLFLAYIPYGVIRKFNTLGDYSYGMYIYAFPIQQSVVSLLPDVSVLVMLMISFLCTLVLSILSWHMVEKKCLRLKVKNK